MNSMKNVVLATLVGISTLIPATGNTAVVVARPVIISRPVVSRPATTPRTAPTQKQSVREEPHTVTPVMVMPSNGNGCKEEKDKKKRCN